jgi:hypothetical protein
MPGGKGAPPGCHHGRFGHAAKAYFGAILPSNKVQGFCGPPPTLSFSFFFPSLVSMEFQTFAHGQEGW